MSAPEASFVIMCESFCFDGYHYTVKERSGERRD
jgi:hypothetical protein